MRLKFSTPSPAVTEREPGCGPVVERRRPAPDPVVPEPPPLSVAPRKPHFPRLPDKAEFHAQYDAQTMKWSGTLTIGDVTVKHEVGGVFTLMRVLDAKYRARVSLFTAKPVLAVSK